MEMIPIVGMLTSSVTVVLVVYFVTRSRQRRVEAQIEMQSRLIDRFGSGAELVNFLHSPAGRQFVTGVQTAPDLLTRERIMSGFTRAIVLSCLGAAFVVLAIADNGDWSIPAAIVFSLGIGYLLATVVSYKLLAKVRAGQLEPMSTDTPQP